MALSYHLFFSSSLHPSCATILIVTAAIAIVTAAIAIGRTASIAGAVIVTTAANATTVSAILDAAMDCRALCVYSRRVTVCVTHATTSM